MCYWLYVIDALRHQFTPVKTPVTLWSAIKLVQLNPHSITLPIIIIALQEELYLANHHSNNNNNNNNSVGSSKKNNISSNEVIRLQYNWKLTFVLIELLSLYCNYREDFEHFNCLSEQVNWDIYNQ